MDRSTTCGSEPVHSLDNDFVACEMFDNARYATGIVYSPTESTLTSRNHESRLVDVLAWALEHPSAPKGRQVGREPCFVAAFPRFGVRFDGGCIAGSLRAQSKARQ